MHEIDHVRLAPESAIIYEHGWQSWSPSTSYPLHARPLRPGTENSRIMNWRPDTRPPADAFWGEGLANDTDCLIARPQMQCREAWAAHIDRYGGLRSSSDQLRDLDAWGLDTTRRLLRRTPVRPFTT
jgi:hypothetical protein